MDHVLEIILGITTAYVFEAREKGRLRKVIAHPGANWRMFVFDYVACGFMGTCIGCFLLEPKTAKEAFLVGLSWEAMAMNLLNSRSRKGNGKEAA